MWGMWGNEKGRFGLCGREMTVPESPGDVFETWTVLDGLFAFGKD
jgi:hypothetical protein